MKKVNKVKKLTPYENDRYARIEQNSAKLKAKGLTAIVMDEILKTKIGVDSSQRETTKEKQPTLSEISGAIEKGAKRAKESLPPISMKAKESMPPISSKEKGANQLQSVAKGLESLQKKAPSEGQQSKKIYCSPSSHLKYLRMRQKEASKEQQSALDKQFGMLDEELLLHEDLMTDEDIIRDIHEGGLQEDASNDINYVPCEADVLVEKENPDAQKKKGRGRTILADVDRCEKRAFIILDSTGQPSGPTKTIVDTFTRFLGTIAKDATLCPLNYTTWKLVPNKDNLWEYVKKRFDISEMGKKYVLAAINADWRTYKSRIKRDHYSRYNTNEERLANRPEHIPENQFSLLLKHWDSDKAQNISQINKENRQKQSDLHTMGPSSFAILRAKLKEDDPEKKEPSEADVYIASRKRKLGRNYLTSYEETLQNIEKLEILKALDNGDPYHDVITKKEHPGRVRLRGRGVTKSTLEKMDPSSSYMMPPMYLEQLDKKYDDMLQDKIADVIAKIRKANPGAELNIPDFEGTEGSMASENDDEGAESNDDEGAHSEERLT